MSNMTSTCPQCGAHLKIVRAGDSTDTLVGDAAPTPQQRNSDQRKDADADSSNLDFSKYHLKRLKEMMCGPLDTYWSPKQPTMRPNLSADPEAIGALKNSRSRETLDRVASKMQVAICRASEPSADILLESRRGGRDIYDKIPRRPELVFEAVRAIVYVMEWTSDDGESGFEKIKTLADGVNAIPLRLRVGDLACEYIFELMLLIDYGFPAYPLRESWHLSDRYFLDVAWPNFETFSSFLTATAWHWRQGQAVPARKAWDQIARIVESWHLIGFDVLPVWDIAIMLYYYYSHRNPVDAEDHEQGWTGYTGVLQEMIAEVPTRGIDRLERKLSLDVHFLIPQFVKNRERRTQMMSISQDLASQHGCRVAFPKMPKVPEIPEMSERPEIPEMPKTPVWRRCSNSLTGLVLSRQRLDDEEQGEEKEKLIEGLE